MTITARRFADVRPGEVVAFSSDAGITIHRVAERDPERLITLGDNLPLYDPPVTEADFLGTVEAPPPPAPAPICPAPIPASRLSVWCPAAPGAAARHLEEMGVPVHVIDPREITGRARVRERAGEGLVVGVSPAGALPATAVAQAAAKSTGDCVIMVGFPFGRSLPGSFPCLPPEVADLHVRLSDPLRSLSLDDSLAALAALVAP